MRMKLRSIKIAAAIFVIVGIVFLSVGCIGQSNSATPAATQIATVATRQYFYLSYRYRQSGVKK